MIKPSKIIGDNYLSRWHLIPRNKYFNIYLHKYIGDDSGRFMHDHPWTSWSILLKGKLEEERWDKTGFWVEFPKRFAIKRREATDIHRLLLNTPVAWTLFITGPRKRDWGFWVNRVWYPHWVVEHESR